MDLTVKSQVLSRNFISKISLNVPYSIIAAIVESADTLAFFHLQIKPTELVEIFQGMSKPAGKKSSLAWSNDGNYLALGSSHLELWKFDGQKIVPLKNFNQDFIDIKVLAWSPDSQSLAYGGLSKKNTVKIKNIQTGATQELSIPLMISSISYDPFGKYLLLHLCNNIVYFYNSNNLSKIRELPLSPNAKPFEHVSTVKESRVMAWSPDFTHLVCPSLDDSKIAVALAFSRNNNFKVRQAFLGHVSSISCACFNPNLYQYQGDITSILALGDSHGVVSLWRVGKKRENQPLILLNSSPQYSEVVDDLCWNQDGDILFANVMKRYINIYTFVKQKFGRQISRLEKTNIIQESYGVTSVSEISQKQLQVFSMDTLLRGESNNDKNGQKFHESKGNHDSTLIQGGQSKKSVTFETNLSGKVQYVKVNEQITIKDKNNRKKIQPAMLVRKDEVQKAGKLTQNNMSVLPGALHAYSTIGQFQPLKLRPLSLQNSLIKLGKKGYLELKRLQGYTIVKLFQQNGKDLPKERVFTGAIDWIKLIGSKLYLLNMGNLYIFGLQLNLLDLPYNLGATHRISINQQGDIYYISTKGLIKGFNHLSKTCFTPVPVTLQSLIQGINWKPSRSQGEEKQEQFMNIVAQMTVEKNHNLYVTLYNSKTRYFYCSESKCWVSLEFNAGLLQVGHSLRVGQHEERLASDFFRSLTSRFLPDTSAKVQTPLQQFESNMIYYQLHDPNPQLYGQNLLGLLKELKARNQNEKLRSQVIKYFVDKESGYYITDSSLRGKVRQLGGSVIQEFVLFEQL